MRKHVGMLDRRVPKNVKTITIAERKHLTLPPSQQHNPQPISITEASNYDFQQRALYWAHRAPMLASFILY